MPHILGSHIEIANAVPQGCILMWSGTIATIPSGWALCDGNNGTPNLLDKFVIAAGSTYAPGDSQGWLSTTLNSPSLVASNESMHTHRVQGTTATPSATTNVNNVGATAVASALHTHTYDTTSAAGTAHSHTISGSVSGVCAKPAYYALAFIMKL